MNKIEFEGYCKAGEIANKLRQHLKSFIKPKMKLIEIANELDSQLIKNNVKPAFPINLSLNEVAAHYTPSFQDETIAEGILKVDFGVEVDGYIADLAFSLDLTEKKEYKEMIELNEKILEKTLESLNYNSMVADIGNNIEKRLEEQKYNIIKNLTGHSLEQYKIHGSTSIPNTKNNNKTLLKEKAIAVEPFLTTGIGEVIEGKPSEIFMLIQDKNTRDSASRKILEYIKTEYKTKPFCKRWLDQKGFKTTFALKILTKEKIIYNFPVLVEKSKKPVSQAEETIIFHDNKVIITTKN